MANDPSGPVGASSVDPGRRILHCDMDCFYAAVHARDDPSLRGKPLVIGGQPQSRGVVAAASYEARAFGVHSAMPASRAYRLCPQAVFLKPDFARYRRESARIFELFRQFTPVIQTVALDEAYLDVTEQYPAFGTATALAREIRRRILEECGLTVSVGVGPNRLVAKIASDFDKPDGLTVVPPERVQAFLDPLPVRRLQGVGPATDAALEELGIRTIAELRAIEADVLTRRFGRYGGALYRYARGLDERPVVTHRERKSLGAERTFQHDLARLEAMDEVLDRLAGIVADGLAKRDLYAAAVTVKVRYPDFTTLSRSLTLTTPSRDAREIAAAAYLLLRRTDAGKRRVRLLGVTASRLETAEAGIQLPLFSQPPETSSEDEGATTDVRDLRQ